MKYVASALALIVAANLGGGGALAAEADADAGVTDVSGVVVIAPTDDGYRTERSSAGTRTDTPLQEVPQAISIVTDDLIRDQSMRGMADVLRFVPGASMGQGEGHRDAPTLRGNASTADFFVDGVRDDVQYLRDLYNVERVEVLKGPNAMIFGRGGGGGIINRVTKRANWTDAREASLELGSFDHRRATVDLSTSPMGAAWSARKKMSRPWPGNWAWPSRRSPIIWPSCAARDWCWRSGAAVRSSTASIRPRRASSAGPPTPSSWAAAPSSCAGAARDERGDVVAGNPQDFRGGTGAAAAFGFF